MKGTSTGMQCIRFFRKIWERGISVQNLFHSHSRGAQCHKLWRLHCGLWLSTHLFIWPCNQRLSTPLSENHPQWKISQCQQHQQNMTAHQMQFFLGHLWWPCFVQRTNHAAVKENYFERKSLLLIHVLLFYIICLGTQSPTQNVFCDLAGLFIRLGLECTNRLENHWLQLEHT